MTPKQLAIAASAIAFSFTVGAAQADMTKQALVNACTACHGLDGNSVGPATPSIANIAPDVLIDIMEAYKSGKTYSTVMGRIAKGYESADFEQMAEYFNAQTFTPAQQDYDRSLVDEGADLHDRYCESCHAEGGKPLPDEDEYWLVAGQWTPYIRYTMSDFREDRREMTRKMAEKLDDMLEKEGEASLEAIYAFWASQQ